MYAIYKAIQISKSLNYKNYIICTDSQAAILDIHSTTIYGEGCSLIFDIISEITENKNKSFVIQWVSGHIGTSENKYVGKLARDATLNEEVDQDFIIPIDDYIKQPKKYNTNLFEKTVKDTNKAIWYKNINNKIEKTPWFNSKKLKRSDII